MYVRERERDSETGSKGEQDERGLQRALDVSLPSAIPTLSAPKTTVWNLLIYFSLSRGSLLHY